MTQKKIAYNKKSSLDYNWTPSWFSCSSYDEELIEAISKFQSRHELKPDGMCGPVTIKKKYKERETEKFETRGFLIWGGNRIPIEWNRVETYLDSPRWKSKYYIDQIGEKRRDIKYMVNHWDVTLNSSACLKILDRRGISCHLLIDNDGTIIQTVDLQNITYHAGSRRWNRDSIGVEISNAYSLKYQEYYTSKGFGPRPIIEASEVHGKTLPPHLGFYPVQEEALRALYRCLDRFLSIPLATPSATTIHPATIEGRFRGQVHHYHLTKKKIDSSGYDIQRQIDIIQSEI